ncbi:MAG: hypothetical protein ABIJ00_14290 [Candidatus Eisenbacteria bacterium]
MNPDSLWIIIGIGTGVAGGILGSLMAWRRSRGERTRAVSPTTATLTLLLAVAAGLVVFKVKTQLEYRLWLLLAPASLIYWFVSQVRMIRTVQRQKQCDPRDEV